MKPTAQVGLLSSSSDMLNDILFGSTLINPSDSTIPGTDEPTACEEQTQLDTAPETGAAHDDTQLGNEDEVAGMTMVEQRKKKGNSKLVERKSSLVTQLGTKRSLGMKLQMVLKWNSNSKFLHATEPTPNVITRSAAKRKVKPKLLPAMKQNLNFTPELTQKRKAKVKAQLTTTRMILPLATRTEVKLKPQSTANSKFNGVPLSA
jgi:hypothetical protein